MLLSSSPLACVAFIVVCAVCTGCVHFSALPVVANPAAGSREVWQELADLAVHVRAFPNEAAEVAQIGRPARAEGYLPLILCFENLGDRCFRASRQAVQLITPTGREYVAAPADEVFAALSYSQGMALWGIPLGVFPAFFLSDRIEEENGRFLEDLKGKLFDDWTLSPSERSCHVLMFFPVGTRRAQTIAPEDCLVRIEVAQDIPLSERDRHLEFLLAPTMPVE